MKKTAKEFMELIMNLNLDEKVKKLDDGEGFGVELPIDEENDKNFRFWLSVTIENDEKYVTIDFEKVLSIKLVLNEDKLEKWFLKSGLEELGDMFSEAQAEPTKSEEV